MLIFTSDFIKKTSLRFFSYTSFVLFITNFTFSLAEDAAVSEKAEVNSGIFANIAKNWSGYVPLLLVFVVFYFFVIRPQNKKRRALEEMIRGVKVGDKVVTHSGILGSIAHVSDRSVKLEVSKGVQISVLKNSIA